MPDKLKFTGTKYYTVKEASDITGINANTLYKLIQRNQIDHFRIKGLGFRFTQEQLSRHFYEGERTVQRHDTLGEDLPF